MSYIHLKNTVHICILGHLYQEEVATPGAVGESTEKDDVQALITKTMNQCKDDKSTDREIEERLARLKDVDPS